MCLGKPQKVIDFQGGYATVEFMGKRKKARSAVELKPGDYVICQAGIVAKQVPKREALVMLSEWEAMNKWK